MSKDQSSLRVRVNHLCLCLHSCGLLLKQESIYCLLSERVCEHEPLYGFGNDDKIQLRWPSPSSSSSSNYLSKQTFDHQRTNERTNERTRERTNERRRKIRIVNKEGKKRETYNLSSPTNGQRAAKTRPVCLFLSVFFSFFFFFFSSPLRLVFDFISTHLMMMVAVVVSRLFHAPCTCIFALHVDNEIERASKRVVCRLFDSLHGEIIFCLLFSRECLDRATRSQRPKNASARATKFGRPDCFHASTDDGIRPDLSRSIDRLISASVHRSVTRPSSPFCLSLSLSRDASFFLSYLHPNGKR